MYNPVNLSLFAYTHNRPINAVDPDGNDAAILHGGFVGGPGGVKELGKTVINPFPSQNVTEYRPSIDYSSWSIRNDNPTTGANIAEARVHAEGSPRIIAGFSIGGDAALEAGKPQGGGNWDLRVVAGARVGSDFISQIEAAAGNSDLLVIVGIEGDNNMANDGWFNRNTAGGQFGDRSYEGILDAIDNEYGSLEQFYERFPNASIQSSTGAHGGGETGRRPKMR